MSRTRIRKPVPTKPPKILASKQSKRIKQFVEREIQEAIGEYRESKNR